MRHWVRSLPTMTPGSRRAAGHERPGLLSFLKQCKTALRAVPGVGFYGEKAGCTLAKAPREQV